MIILTGPSLSSPMKKDPSEPQEKINGSALGKQGLTRYRDLCPPDFSHEGPQLLGLMTKLLHGGPRWRCVALEFFVLRCVAHLVYEAAPVHHSVLHHLPEKAQCHEWIPSTKSLAGNRLAIGRLCIRVCQILRHILTCLSFAVWFAVDETVATCSRFFTGCLLARHKNDHNVFVCFMLEHII